MAPSRPYDGCHGAGDSPPPQCTARAACGGWPSEGEVRETYDALRRLKAPLPGAWPEQLFDALGPQCAAATVGYVAALTPHLVVSSLAGGRRR